MQVLLLEPDFWRFLGIAQILRNEPDLQLIGEHDYAKILSFKRAPTDLKPDLVIVSHALTADTNIAILQRIHTIFPAAQILVEGYDEGLDAIAEVLRAGAKGYFVLSSDPQHLLKAISVVGNGSIWAPREAVVRLARQIAPSKKKPEADLTPHQLAILTLLRQGQKNKDIARALGVAEVTIKSHLTKLYRKFGVSTRLELLAYAVNHQLLPSESATAAAVKRGDA